MNLKDLERDIQLMEESVQRMQSINQNVSALDHQVDNVRSDLIEDLHTLEKNAAVSLTRARVAED